MLVHILATVRTDVVANHFPTSTLPKLPQERYPHADYIIHLSACVALAKARRYNTCRGGVAEWLKAAVLKTVGQQCPRGSNPFSSAIRSAQREVRASSYRGDRDQHARVEVVQIYEPCLDTAGKATG